jgi:MFS family permease
MKYKNNGTFAGADESGNDEEERETEFAKEPYSICVDETMPLLAEDDGISSSPSSPLVVSGFNRFRIRDEERPGAGKRPWRETPSVHWLLPPFLLYCLAMGAVSVPKLNVILNLICRQYGLDAGPGTFRIGDDEKQCQNAEVHSLLAKFLLYAHLLSGTLCAFSSPRLGALSDRYGRTKILAITACGMLLGDVITITAASFPGTISVWWILTEFAFGGLAGSFIATMAIIQSYAADCTIPAKRSAVFGYLHGCMFTGIAIGPFLGGIIVKAADDVLVVFYVALLCHLTFILSVLFLIPESLSKERQAAAREKLKLAHQDNRPSQWLSLTRITSFFLPLQILLPTSDQANKTTRRNLILLSACDMVVFGVTLGSASVVVMYSEYTFKWGTFASSLFVSIANSCRVLMLVAVLPTLFYLYSKHHNITHRSDHFDIRIIRVSIIFDVLGYVGYALAPIGALFTLSGVIASVGGIASPTLQSALTNHVDAERTGELMGAVSFLHALSRVVIPAILNLIYGLTVGRAANAVFWVLVGVFGAAGVAAWGIRPRDEDGKGAYQPTPG